MLYYGCHVRCNKSMSIEKQLILPLSKFNLDADL